VGAAGALQRCASADGGVGAGGRAFHTGFGTAHTAASAANRACAQQRKRPAVGWPRAAGAAAGGTTASGAPEKARRSVGFRSSARGSGWAARDSRFAVLKADTRTAVAEAETRATAAAAEARAAAADAKIAAATAEARAAAAEADTRVTAAAAEARAAAA
jgi:hypothetical protein